MVAPWIHSRTCDSPEAIMGMFSRKPSTGDGNMAKDNNTAQQARDNVISIIGPGMTVTGDCETDGTLRIEGTVEGTVRAGKAVVIGKDGIVKGDVVTQDAIIGGRVTGAVVAESRLELQATSVIDGEIRARRIKLDEGGRINGTVHTGEVRPEAGQGPGAPAAQSEAGQAGAGQAART
jgi:cytoskeletal protein CcmA (bactofilin family)